MQPMQTSPSPWSSPPHGWQPSSWIHGVHAETGPTRPRPLHLSLQLRQLLTPQHAEHGSLAVDSDLGRHAVHLNLGYPDTGSHAADVPHVSHAEQYPVSSLMAVAQPPGQGSGRAGRGKGGKRKADPASGSWGSKRTHHTPVAPGPNPSSFGFMPSQPALPTSQRETPAGPQNGPTAHATLTSPTGPQNLHTPVSHGAAQNHPAGSHSYPAASSAADLAHLASPSLTPMPTDDVFAARLAGLHQPLSTPLTPAHHTTHSSHNLGQPQRPAAALDIATGVAAGESTGVGPRVTAAGAAGTAGSAAIGAAGVGAAGHIAASSPPARGTRIRRQAMAAATSLAAPAAPLPQQTFGSPVHLAPHQTAHPAPVAHPTPPVHPTPAPVLAKDQPQTVSASPMNPLLMGLPTRKGPLAAIDPPSSSTAPMAAYMQTALAGKGGFGSKILGCCHVCIATASVCYTEICCPALLLMCMPNHQKFSLLPMVSTQKYNIWLGPSANSAALPWHFLSHCSQSVLPCNFSHTSCYLVVQICTCSTPPQWPASCQPLCSLTSASRHVLCTAWGICTVFVLYTWFKNM